MTTDSNKALAIIPRTIDEVRSLAAMFAKSALLPQELRGKEADVFVSIMAGQELGLPPMAALRGVHVVKGKPVLSADTMVGIVLGSGLAEYFVCVEEKPGSVTYETKRRGAPHPQRCTWTREDAKRANLGGDNWQKYERAMLKARCKAMLARDAYPDVLAGCYDDDEARDFAPAPLAVIPPPVDAIDAEVVGEENAATPSLLDAIDKANTEAELRALVPQISKLTEAAKADARKRYGARLEYVRKNQPAATQPAQPATEAAS